jgi:hypothetical protein
MDYSAREYLALAGIGNVTAESIKGFATKGSLVIAVEWKFCLLEREGEGWDI